MTSVRSLLCSERQQAVQGTWHMGAAGGSGVHVHTKSLKASSGTLLLIFLPHGKASRGMQNLVPCQ